MKVPNRAQLLVAGPNDSDRRPDTATERFTARVKVGDPIFSPVVRELTKMRILGVEVTPELMDRIIDVELYNEGLRVKVEADSAPAPPKPVGDPECVPTQRKPNGRFAEVSEVGEVVYYMRIGNRVKIGTSTNLQRRLISINPEELMAVERGGRHVESHRHKQFADLRSHGEWFRHEGELATFIAALQEASREHDQPESLHQPC